MSVHKFTWLWLLSKWFLTSPDNIKRQQTIWGLTAQTADRSRLGNSKQATTWLSPSDHFAKVQSHLPTDVVFRTLMNQLVTPLKTAEEKTKGTPLRFHWCFGTKQLNHSQSGSVIQPSMIDQFLQLHWFYSKQHKYVTDRLQVQHWWKALPAVLEFFITVWSIDHFINALPGTHAVHNYKAVDQSYTINRLWLQ